METDRRWNFVFVNLTLKITIDGIEFEKWQFSTFFPKLHNISTETIQAQSKQTMNVYCPILRTLRRCVSRTQTQISI